MKDKIGEDGGKHRKLYFTMEVKEVYGEEKGRR